MAEPRRKITIPLFTVHDRCRKAREEAGLEQEELATLIEVSRGTISNYENAVVTRLKTPVLRRWALATGVPFEWLRDGVADPSVPGGDEDRWAARDSNPEPAELLPEAA